MIEKTLKQPITDLTCAFDLPRLLQDGVLLCAMLNAIVEDKYKVDVRHNASSAAAKRRNANTFVETCRRLNIVSVQTVTSLDIVQGDSTASLIAVLKDLLQSREAAA